MCLVIPRQRGVRLTPLYFTLQSKIKIEETKRVLGLVTISHALILMVLSILDLTRTSMVLNILTAALAMFTCGVGAAKVRSDFVS